MLLAVNADEVALPEEFVTAVALSEPAKAALGPDDGAVNVTVTPETGLPAQSVTVAVRGFENFAPIIALWPLPPVATMLVAIRPMLVRGKFAVLARLGADATTL